MTKSLLRRRELLVQLGGAAFLATPVFRDALGEAKAATPVRLVILGYPGGVRFPGNSQPEYDHSSAVRLRPLNFDFNGVLSSFAPLQADLLFLNGIGNFALAPDDGHVPQSMLTGDSRGRVEGNEFVPADMSSIDQVVARAVGSQTRFSSLQLAVQHNTQRWHWVFDRGTAVDNVTSPSVLFTRLFGNGAPTPTPGTEPSAEDAQAKATLERQLKLKQSSLDQFTRELQIIKSLAGTAEQQKLELHLTSIRELEKGLASQAQGGGASMPGAGCAAPSIGTGTDIPALGAAMNELLFQALNCDLTRVATLDWLNASADTLGLRFIPGINSERTHHQMEHEPDSELDVAQAWIFSQIAAFLRRLKDTPEGSGSMLDNTVVMVTSSMSDGRYHMGSPHMGFLAGKGGGKLTTGRTLELGGVALNDLYVSLANVMGANITSFGEAKFNRSPVNLA